MSAGQSQHGVFLRLISPATNQKRERRVQQRTLAFSDSSRAGLPTASHHYLGGGPGGGGGGGAFWNSRFISLPLGTFMSGCFTLVSGGGAFEIVFFSQPMRNTAQDRTEKKTLFRSNISFSMIERRKTISRGEHPIPRRERLSSHLTKETERRLLGDHCPS